jgi:hypothetical protein
MQLHSKATKALTDANALLGKIDLVNQDIADVDGRITGLNTYIMVRLKME